jgi:hypothetical protein
MYEIRFRIIADPAKLQGDCDALKIGKYSPRQANIGRHPFHMQALLCDATTLLGECAVGFGRAISRYDVERLGALQSASK